MQYLNSICIPAIAITDVEDPEITQQVLNGNFLVVFGSPECLLSTALWSGIFKSESRLKKNSKRTSGNSLSSLRLENKDLCAASQTVLTGICLPLLPTLHVLLNENIFC